jgi:methylase of polypeptide subunit release factors
LLEPAEGRFFLEFGEGQAEAVRGILQAGGLAVSGVVADLSGRARVAVGRRIPS